MQIKQKQSYAPFGSISSKSPKKKKKNQKTQQPGPGAYQVALPFVTPIVQTIRKPNNNVIVKLGHFGTAPFLAGGDRFSIKAVRQQLGPGSYQNTQTNKSILPNLRRSRKYAAQKLREIIKSPIETVPTITGIKKVQFDDQIQMPSALQKSRSKDRDNKYRGLNWSRMSQQRSFVTQKSTNNLDVPGPGSYEVAYRLQPIPLQRNLSPSFNSKSVRSFLDHIVFETNQDVKARQRQQRKYKSDVVGPGSYNVEGEKHKKFEKYQFFGSTQQRM